MLLQSSKPDLDILYGLIRRLSDRYFEAIHNDKPLKDAKEIRKAIRYIEKKIANAEQK